MDAGYTLFGAPFYGLAHVREAAAEPAAAGDGHQRAIQDN
jgi:hypothetical protein